MKYSCLVFSEGAKDKKFLIVLIDLPKFKYHTSNWSFNYDNASGSSPETILYQCKKAILGKSYDLILCFIDLDVLKSNFPKNWKMEKNKLEIKYSNIKIIWQIDNAEDEYRRILGEQYKAKKQVNKLAKQKSEKFVNSAYWKRILSTINNREKELTKANKTELEDALDAVNLYKKEKKTETLKELNSVKELM